MQAREVQAPVFEFLENPDTHGGAPVRRFDTHASAVFLAGDRALKVKRAVSFPFLDYSTLDKRRAACIAELEVNRRFAPELYRRVVPITREGNGQFEIDGRGDIVEWAVEMKRFDENDTLDHIADRGALNSHMAAQLAAMTRAIHRNAPPADPARWLDAIGTYIRQNSEAFRSYPAIFAEPDVARLQHAFRKELLRLTPLLIRRGEQGFVRHGHGDLHLGNIALVDGHPIAFDAIEFSPVIASGDILYELAFLLMDLIERGQVANANIILNQSIDLYGALDELDGLALLPMFMSLRAAIRAKVTAARTGQGKGNISTIEASAKAYFDLALRLLEPRQPQMICIGGLSGVGKSAMARRLAETIPPLPGALVLRSDAMRKQMFGCSEFERLPAEAYDPAVSARVYADLAARAVRTVQANHSVIVDATFASGDARTMIERSARDAGMAPVGLFMVADTKTRISRIAQRGPDVSDADARLARAQETYDLTDMTWTTIDASGPFEQTFQQIRAVVSRRDPGAFAR